MSQPDDNWRAILVFADNQQKPLCSALYLSDLENRWGPALDHLPPAERDRVRCVKLQRWAMVMPYGTWLSQYDLWKAPLAPPPKKPVNSSVELVPPKDAEDGGAAGWPVGGDRMAKPTPPTVPVQDPSKLPLAPRVPELSDPLDEPDSTAPPDEPPVNSTSVERYNRLLFWVSAAGEGTWETFRKTCRTLELAADPGWARRVLRRLQLLGHLSLTDNGKRWIVPTPFLLPTVLDGDQYLLCGQRTPSLLNDLPLAHCPDEQVGGEGPTRIVLRVDNNSPNVVAGGVTIQREAQGVLQRAEQLPTLQEWCDKLRRVDRPALSSFATIERWANGDWQTEQQHQLREHNGKYIGPAGMYRLTRTEPYHWTLTVFFDVERQRFLRGDWYGLRYLARKAAQLPCQAFVRERDLLLHSDERWPLRFEQALVQATGLLPQRIEKGKWLRYTSLPEELAHLLCQRLGIEVKPAAPRQSETAAALAGR